MTTAIDVALLVLRVAVGGLFVAHGIKHARGRAKTAAWFGSIGFEKPHFQWFASTATELGVGVLLILGLLTAPAAAGLIGTMFVAYWTVHRFSGFWITAYAQEGIEAEGWEFVFTLAAAALALAVAGPGAVSVDDAIGIADDLDGWVGAALAAGGLVVAAGQIATFWRPAR